MINGDHMSEICKRGQPPKIASYGHTGRCVFKLGILKINIILQNKEI